MAKIGIVLHPYKDKKAGGLGRSIFNLAKEIIEQGNDCEYVIFTKGKKEKLDWKGNWSMVTLPERYFWLDRFLGRYREDIDVWVFFTPMAPIIKPLENSIVVVHDMGVWTLHASSVKHILIQCVQKRVLLHAGKIVAVSEQTKNDLLEFVPEVKSEVQVIYNGFDVITGPGKKVSLPDSPYFLFIGVVKKRKNPLRIIKAFELFKEKMSSNHILVFAGVYSTDTKVVKYAKSSKYAEDIIFLGIVSDEERAYLYINAHTFLFPSLFEGFGLPILEAMSAGIPVITSKGGATEEVADKAAILVNPRNIEDIASAMMRVTADKSLYTTCSIKGKERTKNFSWEKSGERYNRCIASLYENK